VKYYLRVDSSGFLGPSPNLLSASWQIRSRRNYHREVAESFFRRFRDGGQYSSKVPGKSFPPILLGAYRKILSFALWVLSGFHWKSQSNDSAVN